MNAQLNKFGAFLITPVQVYLATFIALVIAQAQSLMPKRMDPGGAGTSGRSFIVLAIAIVVALVISPVIFQEISAANSTSKITGTLATIVNLVPLFYYLGVAILAVVTIYQHL